MTNRREFLQTTAVITGASLLPKNLFASPIPTFHFVQTTTLKSWTVFNPTQWCLDHKHEPIFERARDGLCNLTKEESDRIIRLVVRRCGLNLIEVQSNQVTVHHWSQQLVDLRPFFKEHQLTSPDVQVTLLDRKKETIANKTGDEFLYGTKIAHDFPIELFVSKWNNRFQKESDDHQAAPYTNSGFAWDRIEDGQIPWEALKSAWRRSQPTSCLNCSGETVLVNFGVKQVGLFNRLPNFISICPKCKRSFADDSIKEFADWIEANLETGFCPVAELVWGKRIARVYA